MSIVDKQPHLDTFRIAWQSALAALLCLGLPVGLLFWLIIFRGIANSKFLARMVVLLQDYGMIEIMLYLMGAFMWGILLARISRYRPAWQVALATVLGAIVGRETPLTYLNTTLDNYIPGLSPHVLFTAFLSGIIFSVAGCISLAYGLVLRSAKAALTMIFTTSLVCIATVLLTIVLLDQFGIQVGTGNSAMPKVTAVSLITSAVTGGMTLGVTFSHFVAKAKHNIALYGMETDTAV